MTLYLNDQHHATRNRGLAAASSFVHAVKLFIGRRDHHSDSWCDRLTGQNAIAALEAMQKHDLAHC